MTKRMGLLVLCTCAALAGAAGQDTWELAGGWTLALDRANVGRKENWAAAARPDARPVPVPGVVQQVYPYDCGVAWYYRRLARPADLASGLRLKLRFGAVDYASEVYLDGQLLGAHEGAEDPFVFDVTDRLKADSLLAVRVVVPGREPVDGFTCNLVPHRNKFDGMQFKPGWCYLTGGLTLPVTLAAVPDVRVRDAFVRADWKTGEIVVETTVVNDRDRASPLDLSFRVRSDDVPGAWARHDVSRAAKDVPPGESTFAVSFKVPNFRLWSLETPNVYTLDVETSGGDVARGSFSTTFGFRDLRLVNGWFHLNGRRILLKSAHTGNHMPGGLAVVDPKTPELEYRDFHLMKSMGYNTVRFIATCATPRQLDYCDRLGLLVYQETYASWCLRNSPDACRRYLDSIRAELRRDRNHPALAIWGALNETKQEDAFQAARGMLPEMRTIDPTRMWILNSGRWDLFPSSRDAKGWSAQPPGAPDPDWSIGSAANPGASSWENHWGQDGDLGGAKATAARAHEHEPPYYGDLHFYPGYPHNETQARKLREWGKGTRPVIISEYGVGSLLDVIDHCAEFERRGIRRDAPDFARMAEIRAKFLADWTRLGLDRFFADPVDFLRASERFNARSRREGFDLVRSNPRLAGFNLTGALDHAICGEGPLSLFRRVKDANFDVFRDGWSDLRWCLFLSRYNQFAGEPIVFEAVLADFDALRDGAYSARFAIVDADGALRWRSEPVSFAVPQKDSDGLRAVVYPIAKMSAAVVLPPGAYRLRAYLDHGGYAAAHEKGFFVTARPVAAAPGDEVIDLSAAGTDEAAGTAAMAKVAAGATALVRLGTWGTKPPKFLPLAGLVVRPREHWLYHDDSLLVPNPLLEGLKTGFLDWDFYDSCFPLFGFASETAPESVAAVNFGVGGPRVYTCTFSLAVYRHGRGRIVVSTLPLRDASPAGATILANVRALARRMAEPASK